MTLETPARIEPCGIEETVPMALSDLVMEIHCAAEDLGSHLHSDSAAELRNMTRIANAYYSHLIEGHDTRPRDIELALAGRLDTDKSQPFALEAAAHVNVQAWIDKEAVKGTLPSPTTSAFIRELHRRYYEALPAELRVAKHGDLRREMIPGEFRADGHEVTVGRHMPPAAHRIKVFMTHYERRYHGLTRGDTGRILSIPAAHHRLAYIHPFDDGNGRIGRLMSHAMCHAAGIAGQGLWSISRGLARGLRDPAEYKERMEAADQPRRGDLDGRGNLSLATLEGFTGWFLTVMLRQLQFAKAMFDLDRLGERYEALIRDLYPDRARLPQLISHVLRRGEMPRGEAHLVLGVSESSARADLEDLVIGGFLKTASAKSPVRLAFPLVYSERLFPGFLTDA